jgi:two-component system cell cycle sensor histidine kinase/response regulator CckA
MMLPDKVHSVLIVEDERIVAKDLQQTLVSMGYDAFAIASSADEAIKRASERCPDIVLMDIRIKGQRDGIETAELLRSRFGVPVVFLTAHADEATLQRAKKTEAHGYLMKPVKCGELRSAIEVAIYKHDMEKRLRERERWFSTTLRSIADAVVTVDLAGNVTFMNSAAETLTGVTAAAAIGRPVRDIVQLLDPKQPTSPLDEVLEHKQTIVIEEAALKHATNTGRIISDSVSTVIDDGQILGAVMVFRDITEQKLLQKQLELADRLASLGTMAAGVAHEVNNPLAVVIANATYVLEELRLQQATGKGDVRGLAEAIQAQSDLESAAHRIARIIAELQAFSRPTQPTGEASDVAAAVAWAVRSTAHELRDRANVITNIAAVPQAGVDETRLAQVLVNLMMNAAHAILPGRAERNTVTIVARELDNNVVIEVRDTGCGMPPDVLQHVFEPFYTTRPQGTGTGLGLSVCHGIVTSVGGRLEAESRGGEGSTFRVTLPVAVRSIAPSAASPAPVVANRRGRILVIDDEPMVLKTMERMLSGHDLVYVDDARKAVALLARGDQFDIIFSDVMMPCMTGIELYEHLLASHPDAALRVVFLTGGAVNARMADFLAVVRNTCLEKPFPVDALRAFVQQRLASQDGRSEESTRTF